MIYKRRITYSLIYSLVLRVHVLIDIYRIQYASIILENTTSMMPVGDDRRLGRPSAAVSAQGRAKRRRVEADPSASPSRSSASVHGRTVGALQLHGRYIYDDPAYMYTHTADHTLALKRLAWGLLHRDCLARCGDQLDCDTHAKVGSGCVSIAR